MGWNLAINISWPRMLRTYCTESMDWFKKILLHHFTNVCAFKNILSRRRQRETPQHLWSFLWIADRIHEKIHFLGVWIHRQYMLGIFSDAVWERLHHRKSSQHGYTYKMTFWRIIILMKNSSNSRRKKLPLWVHFRKNSPFEPISERTPRSSLFYETKNLLFRPVRRNLGYDKLSCRQ